MLALIGFFTSPLGRLAGMALIAVAIYSTGYVRATIAANGKCEAAQLKAELEAKERDLVQGDLAGDDDDARLAQILKSTTSNRERFDAFKTEIARRTDSACRLTDGDIASLRLDGSDAEECRATAGAAAGAAAGRGAAVGRDARAVLADYRGALREANSRLCAAAKWYDGVRSRYGKSPLR